MARVLLVDDDDKTLEVLEFSLTLDGHLTIRAASGEEALAAARRHGPDVVIIDATMPVMDGLAATRLLRSDPELHATPVVMLTSPGADADIWRVWQVGVDAYVPKPLDLDVLNRELARLGVLAAPVGA